MFNIHKMQNAYHIFHSLMIFIHTFYTTFETIFYFLLDKNNKKKKKMDRKYRHNENIRENRLKNYPALLTLVQNILPNLFLECCNL